MSYQDIDTQALRQAINDFAFYSRPSNADSSRPCTNKDLNKVINKLTELLNVFVDELEN